MGTTKAAAVTTTSPVTTFDNISSDDISTCNLNIIMKLFAAMILALLGSALAMPQDYSKFDPSTGELPYGELEANPFGDNPHGFRVYLPSKDGNIWERLPSGRVVEGG